MTPTYRYEWKFGLCHSAIAAPNWGEVVTFSA